MGNSSYIQYASATSPSVYKRSIKSSYPINTYTLPLSVVAKVTRDNGAVGSQVNKYFYEDLRLHIAGKGMLGFNTVTNENTTLGTKEVNSVTKWNEKLWIPKRRKPQALSATILVRSFRPIPYQRQGITTLHMYPKRM